MGIHQVYGKCRGIVEQSCRRIDIERSAHHGKNISLRCQLAASAMAGTISPNQTIWGGVGNPLAQITHFQLFVANFIHHSGWEVERALAAHCGGAAPGASCPLVQVVNILGYDITSNSFSASARAIWPALGSTVKNACAARCRIAAQVRGYFSMPADWPPPSHRTPPIVRPYREKCGYRFRRNTGSGKNN